MAAAAIVTGRIRSFSPMNGYGFIAPADGVPGRDIFFHISDFAADAEPAVGLRVEYTVGESRSGKPRAVSVAPIPPAA